MCSRSCIILFGLVNYSMFLNQDKTEFSGHRHFYGMEDLPGDPVPNLEWSWPLIVVLEFEIVLLEEQN